MRVSGQFIVGLLAGIFIAAIYASLPQWVDTAAAANAAEPSLDDQRLATLFADDQADRQPLLRGEWPTTWWGTSYFVARDLVRQGQVMAFYQEGKLRTANDYYHAAMILQHAQQADDQLLAHEFCIVAVSKGHRGALWLAAASEDRFLMRIKRPQRFGTQYSSASMTEPLTLYTVSPRVTDGLRCEMHVPTLAQARAQEAKYRDLLRGAVK